MSSHTQTRLNSLHTVDQCCFSPGNPLLCGCDIAWLVRNHTLLEAVDVYTTCADGRLLASLDPADYDHC